MIPPQPHSTDGVYHQSMPCLRPGEANVADDSLGSEASEMDLHGRRMRRADPSGLSGNSGSGRAGAGAGPTEIEETEALNQEAVITRIACITRIATTYRQLPVRVLFTSR